MPKITALFDTPIKSICPLSGRMLREHWSNCEWSCQDVRNTIKVVFRSYTLNIVVWVQDLKKKQIANSYIIHIYYIARNKQ
jgi:hypothetical protein